MIRLNKYNRAYFESYARDRFNAIQKENPALSKNAIIEIMAVELQMNKKTLYTRLLNFGIIETEKRDLDNLENAEPYGRKAFIQQFKQHANLHGVLQMKGFFNDN